MDPILSEIYEGVIEGQAQVVQEKVTEGLKAGLDPAAMLNEGMIAAMKEVGRRFEEGDYFVPEMLISARAMQSGLALLKPHLLQSNIQSAGKVAIGTVKGDLHDIGKNLVAMMLEGAGFEIIDLGTDVSPEKFVDAVKTHQVDIVAMSALLTTTMTNMKHTIDALDREGLRRHVKVMIGGAPITEAYQQSIEADGYAPDASRAVALAQRLLEKE